MSLGRNNYRHVGAISLLNQCVTIVSFVRDQIACIYPFNKRVSLSAISPGTFCNKHSDRHTMRIHGQVYF